MEDNEKTWRILGYEPFKKGEVVRTNKDIIEYNPGDFTQFTVPKDTLCCIRSLPFNPTGTYPYTVTPVFTDNVKLKGMSLYMDERNFEET